MATVDELTKEAKKKGALTASTQPSSITITETEKVTPLAPNGDRIQAIKDMYDKQTQANVDRVNASLAQQKSDAQAAKDKLNPLYQQKANDLAVQYERNRRNFNQQALSRGLNTGAASQAALAQNSEYLKDFGALRGKEAEQLAEADRGILDLETQAKAKVDELLALGEKEKAAAVWDEYNRMQVEKMNQAKLLAQFGDFSGFAEIMGKDKADSMQSAWNAQNPLLAWNTGKISADQYYKYTGAYPPGYTPPYYGGGDSGGGGYGYGDGSGDGGDGGDDDAELRKQYENEKLAYAVANLGHNMINHMRNPNPAPAPARRPTGTVNKYYSSAKR